MKKSFSCCRRFMRAFALDALLSCALFYSDNVESDTGYESEGEYTLKERPKRRNGSDKRVITIKVILLSWFWKSPTNW
jgi:hypothetical protein